MRVAEYASPLPHVYVLKSRLLTPEQLRELASSRSLEEFLSIIKDTRYGTLETTLTPLGIAEAVKKRLYNERKYVLELSPTKPKCIIDGLEKWFEEKETLLLIEALINGVKPIKIYGELARDLFSKIDMGIVTVDSTPQGVRRAIESIADREIRSSWLSQIDSYAETGSIDFFYADSLARLLSRIDECLKENDERNAREIRGLLCPLMDYYVMLYVSNIMKNRKPRFTDRVPLLRGCRVKGNKVLSFPDASAIVSVYEKIMDSYGIPHSKITSIEEGEFQLNIGVKKLLRRRCLRVFPSYPFKPSVFIALYLLLVLEEEDLMKILSGITYGMNVHEILASLSST